MIHWYVVNTKAKEESKAAFNLRRQGYEVYLPQYIKKRSHARRVDYVKAPLFPKYLFVKLDLEVEQWARINSTLGVNRLISFGVAPTPVPVGIIELIKDREDGQGFVSPGQLFKFEKGDQVNVETGAFADQLGVFDQRGDGDRVFILLKLMGREVRVRLPMDAISA